MTLEWHTPTPPPPGNALFSILPEEWKAKIRDTIAKAHTHTTYNNMQMRENENLDSS